MLATLISNLLIVSLLFIVIGWASDAIRAIAYRGRNYLNSEGTAAWGEMSGPRRPVHYVDTDATGRARSVQRHQPDGRLPLDRLSIGRLLPYGTETWK